jgi:hypothetical protein
MKLKWLKKKKLLTWVQQTTLLCGFEHLYKKHKQKIVLDKKRLEINYFEVQQIIKDVYCSYRKKILTQTKNTSQTAATESV